MTVTLPFLHVIKYAGVLMHGDTTDLPLWSMVVLSCLDLQLAEPKTPAVADKIDIISAFQSYGQYLSKQINNEERIDIVKHACPGPGACGGMYTANTMASAPEVLGLTLPFSSSSVSKEKAEECANVGFALKNLLELDLKPRDIVTKNHLKTLLLISLPLVVLLMPFYILLPLPLHLTLLLLLTISKESPNNSLVGRFQTIG